MLKHRQTAGTVFVPPVSKTDSAKHLLAARQAALNQQYLINKRIAMTRGLGRLPASNMPRITTRKSGSIGQMASGRTRNKRSSRFKPLQRTQISAQAQAQQKQRDEAAAKKRAEVLAAAKKRAESDIAAAKKKAEEEAAIVAAARKKKKDEDIAAARKKDEDIAAARKKAAEDAAAKKKAEEDAAAKKKAEEDAAAKKKVEEDAAALKTKSLFEKTGLKRKNKKKRKKT
jgi:hypothetical protein